MNITYKLQKLDQATRTTTVVDIIKELNEYMVETCIYDPYANAEEVRHEYGLDSGSAP